MNIHSYSNINIKSIKKRQKGQSSRPYIQCVRDSAFMYCDLIIGIRKSLIPEINIRMDNVRKKCDHFRIENATNLRM